jgi:hypothetical protein
MVYDHSTFHEYNSSIKIPLNRRIYDKLQISVYNPFSYRAYRFKTFWPVCVYA